MTMSLTVTGQPPAGGAPGLTAQPSTYHRGLGLKATQAGIVTQVPHLILIKRAVRMTHGEQASRLTQKASSCKRFCAVQATGEGGEPESPSLAPSEKDMWTHTMQSYT